MPKLKLYREKSVQNLFSKRPGETKLGEKIAFLSGWDDLQKSESQFVLLGIPEDIGVRANHGNPGTFSAWKAFLKAFLNLQENRFLSAEKLLLLGEIDCSEEMKKATFLDLSDPNYFPKMGDLVKKIDNVVSETVTAILAAGKTPILIGGGHNNAYGNIKGASQGLKTPINVLNIDAHTDLRQLEHRHSGNGFSYAKERGFLKKYAVFGLQQNYTSETIFDQFQDSPDLKYFLFEDLLFQNNLSEFDKAIAFLDGASFGLEIDCDVMVNFPSSAQSPSGFSLDEIRKFLKMAAENQNCCYLHLCEAMESKNYPTGKALSFLVSDFLKAKSKIEIKKLEILPFSPQLATHFKQLNTEWLEKYFYVEPHDKEVLANPQKTIIEPGGYIFFGKLQEEIVGTFAFIKVSEGIFELTKMAISPEKRGKKLGQELLHFSIGFAKQQNWQEIILYSSRRLKNALHLYQKFGFEEVPIEKNNPYARGDIKMKLQLS